MGTRGVSRRDVLRTLAIGAAGGSVLQMIPAAAAEYAHQVVQKEKAASAAGKYTPKYFAAHPYETLKSLCDTIIPKDDHSGGAVEAGAPEFIDLLTSENEEFQVKLGGGLMWLDNSCADRYQKTYLECAPEQQKEFGASCPQSYPGNLTNIESDWNDISAAVAFVKKLRHVKKLNLVGWSQGGPRAGGRC